MQLRAQANLLSADLSSRIDDLKSKHEDQLHKLVQSLHDPFARVPPRPHLHLGRDSEAQTVAEIIVGASGRVAILGGPGMGKTSLAVAVSHHPAVIARFGSRRFFVSCDAAEGQSTFLPTLAAAFGISGTGRKATQQKLLARLGSDPTLLVLDNFESAWEADHQRQDAEELLQFLDAISNLSLILTLRGAERPFGVRWTQPLLPPLLPLADSAALHIFCSISDLPDHDTKALADLLGYLGNIPLAIVLMANLMQVESLTSLLRRWHEFNTAILIRGDGQHRLNSLDISIRLSLESPRMLAAPAAGRLLSLLSMAPYGVAESSLDAWNTASPQTVSALLQNALAVRREQRLFVLAPIRSFMLDNLPPSDDELVPFCSHYFGLADLACRATRNTFNAEHFSAIAPELGNIEAMARYALTNNEGNLRRSALKATTCLVLQFHRTNLGSAPELIPVAAPVAREAGRGLEHAEFLHAWASLAMDLPVGNPKKLLLEARDLYEHVGNWEGTLDCAVLATEYYPANEAVAHARRLFSEASSRNDPERMARCTHQIAVALRRDGQLLEAIAQHERELSLLQQAHGGPSETGSADRRTALCLVHLAGAYRDAGTIGLAVSTYRRGLEIFQATQALHGIYATSYNLASLYLGKGEMRMAIAQATHAIDTYRAAGRPSAVACLLILAHAYAALGDDDSARTALEGLERSARTSNEMLWQWHVWETRGVVAMFRGDLDEARALFEVARTHLRRTDDHGATREDLLGYEASGLRDLAAIELREGNDRGVELAAVNAAVHMHCAHRSADVAGCLVLLSEVVDAQYAERLLEAVLLPLQRMELFYDIGIALVRSATIATERGQNDLAIHRARNALRYLGDIQDEWRIGVAQKIIEAAGTTK